MTNPSELVGDVDVCPHCRGTGQPHGIMGGPEHGLCSWCKGTGQKFSSPRNPSETRDSELTEAIRMLADDADAFAHIPAIAALNRRAREAADTIDRLTSSGEAYGWVFQDSLDPSREPLFTRKPYVAEVWRNAHGTVTPLYTSPREGHVEVPVEPTEVLWIAFSMEYAVEGYENFAKAYRAMLSALPHNQGETKP